MALIEAKSYAQKHCKVQEALKYYAFLDTPDAIAPKSSTPEAQFDWQVPVVAAATGATLHTAAMGQRAKASNKFG